MSTPLFGSVGVWAGARDFARQHGYEGASFEDRAGEIEQLGYGALWVGATFESHLTPLEEALANSQNLTVGSSIVNIWTAPAKEVAASFHRLEARFPGRLVLGVGAGHREAQGEVYQSPYKALVSYLDELEEAGVPKDRIAIAALRARALRLSAQRTVAALPFLVPVEHTRKARELLGPGPKIATEVKVVFGDDQTVARRMVGEYLKMSNYVNSLRENGFPELHVGDEPSDALVDALVLRGAIPHIAAGVKERLAAGADHVAVQVLQNDHDPVAGLAELATELRLGGSKPSR
ncbi:TIGR03620 family F420-dependent LLM class oxidoreductase [Mycobacteroides chelonae]|uniref:LLM class F420-dependent oxidoreductase n=1 Tax=Mycobacteroides chelonae TaxID=1774 RepID=A0A1S1M2I2_MYCCH|nr:TIGR03620 family F420-dependent LLM class oxidoreductase [Mycobacteroides chelonae]OHU78839.1 LLM class F420-dependent oxidoreductase [Mycobacteroides chelonae]QQG85957.1 TIGR03620 family F420-dependent LLM class oxidoreductase [Mycobacteroides chelonae]QQG90774.1 TIGR03620 family F420-dependent LLM class oxidoreductase [Mycobacteroides chelonae]